jgi:hypothetical protein
LRKLGAADTETLVMAPHHVAGEAAGVAFEDEIEVSRDTDGVRKDQQRTFSGEISNGTINDRSVVVEHDFSSLQNTATRRFTSLLHRAPLLQKPRITRETSNSHADRRNIPGSIKSMD